MVTELEAIILLVTVVIFRLALYGVELVIVTIGGLNYLIGPIVSNSFYF